MDKEYMYVTTSNIDQRAAEPPRTFEKIPLPKSWDTRSQLRCFRRERSRSSVYTVHPKNAESYYLRMVLHAVRGPTSFRDIRTIEEELCTTFREACQKLGLLGDDQHWDHP